MVIGDNFDVKRLSVGLGCKTDSYAVTVTGMTLSYAVMSLLRHR